MLESNKIAQEVGLSRMTLAEINVEIKPVRHTNELSSSVHFFYHSISTEFYCTFVIMENESKINVETGWVKIVDKACADYELLTADERIWFNIQSLIDQVDNGGLISHYYNSGADHNKETIEDLQTLDFDDVADLLIQINNLFPNGQPSVHIDERNDIISSWPNYKYDTFFEKLDAEFYGRENQLERKLISYIEAKCLKL